MKHPEHICRFNDAPQSCDCYDAGYIAGGKDEKNRLFNNPLEIFRGNRIKMSSEAREAFLLSIDVFESRSQASSAINEEINKSKV